MRVYDEISESIKKIKNFSGVLTLRDKNELVFSKICGYADIPNKRENNLETRFGVASGAKIFTAISICKLVQEGKLKFDSLIKDYIDLQNYDDSVTIEHLLTHTSGIPDYFDEDEMDDFSELWREVPMYLLREPKDFLPLLKKGKMKFKPGEKFAYNNSGFVVLSLIVEKVSGQSFKAFVQENIFDVLNMKASGYFAMDMLPENCAYGYEEKEKGQLKSNIYSIPVVGGGDGGVFVTEEDMDKLWRGLLNFKILNKDITKKMLTPHVYVNYDVYYGYGIWIIKREEGIYKYYLTGSDPGVTFMSAIYPEKDTVVNILGNKEFSNFELSKKIEEYFM